MQRSTILILKFKMNLFPFKNHFIEIINLTQEQRFVRNNVHHLIKNGENYGTGG